MRRSFSTLAVIGGASPVGGYNRRMTTPFTFAALLLAVIACGDTHGSISVETESPTRLPAATSRAEPSVTQPSATPTSIPPKKPSVIQPPVTTKPAPVQLPGTKVPLGPWKIEPAFPNMSLSRMVAMASPDDVSDRLFVALQPGQVVLFRNDRDVETAEMFLDISDRVDDRGQEEGLLGLAFDPGYVQNGYFYVYYSASDPKRSVVSRFTAGTDGNSASSETERVFLEVPQPFSNHNGGQIAFGPDGYLYVGLGDGGGGGDTQGSGQELGSLLGAILRIDVGTIDSIGSYSVPRDNPFVGREGARPEIWAYGLRNPWRFSFDRATGDLWAADVGQNRFEEVDLILPGFNYGWNVMEGSRCFATANCDQSGLELPVAEYGRDEGCSVTGGYVYRGARLPSLRGAYVYADFCSGRIWALRYDGSEVTEHMKVVDSGLQISSFAEDRSGELYVLSFDGKIYEFVP